MQQRPDISARHRHHAVLGHRIFDGRRWHNDAAVLIEDGCVRGLTAPGEVPGEWPQRWLPDGILLAPITAQVMTAVIEGRRPEHDLTAFSPRRFH